MNQPVPTVFLPSVPVRWAADEGRFVPVVDLSPALTYGHLAFLTDTNDAQFEPIAMSQTIAAVRRRLAMLLAKDDYIVAIGDPILIAACMAYALDKHGAANMLRWDRMTKKYQLIKVTK